MDALIRIPDGLGLVPTGGVIEVYWMCDHPQNYDIRTGSVATTSHFPRAVLYLGQAPALLQDDGRIWVPELHDLTDAGRMLRATIMDNLPDHGIERIGVVHGPSLISDLRTTQTHALMN